MAAKKRGLGRGLEALLGGDAEPVLPSDGDGELRTLVIQSIQPGKYQPRHAMDPERLDELAASIRAQGVTIGFWEHFRIGAPLTIATILVGIWWL